MWKAQCDLTEKMALLPQNPRLPWEFVYLGNPHVPRDFDKIQDAVNSACKSSFARLRVLPGTEFVYCISNNLIASTLWLQNFFICHQNLSVRGGNVFIASGEYREHLSLSRDVTLRATASAMAQGGVSIAYRTPRQDVPAVTVKGGNVNFIGIKFTHGCRGQDIWNGNSALLINGPSVVSDRVLSVHHRIPRLKQNLDTFQGYQKCVP